VIRASQAGEMGPVQIRVRQHIKHNDALVEHVEWVVR